MSERTRLLRATVLAAPLGALALSVQAADIASTIKEQQQFSTLAEAIEAAGMAEWLQGEGPYTVFAPTDQAFDRLPPGVWDALMEEENREQLKSLLQYHVIEGEEIMAEDVLGKQSEVETASGERLSVDGTGQMILLLPEHGGMETAIDAESGMPASEHQQEVLAEEPATEMRQTAEEGAVPSSPHQEQVLREEPAAGQQTGQQSEIAQPQPTQEGGVPSSPHQEQVLRDQPAGEQAGVAQPQTAQDMPSSPHQEQVLRGEQGGQQAGTTQPQTAQDMPSSPHQEQVLREEPATERQAGQQGAATVVEPDIEADNGVIHAVDALLVPQSVLRTLGSAGTPAEGETGSEWRAGDEQG